MQSKKLLNLGIALTEALSKQKKLKLQEQQRLLKRAQAFSAKMKRKKQQLTKGGTL